MSRSMTCVCIAILGIVGLSAMSCTTFMMTDGDVVLMGDSEDAGPRHPLASDPGAAYAFFLPGSGESYGRMHVGWLWQGERRSYQAGMNEMGLAYGLTSVPSVGMNPHPEKPYQRSEGNLFDRLLRMAANVNEAIDLLQETGFEDLAFQIQLVDSGGQSVVAGPGASGELALTFKAETDTFQVATTFNLAHPSEAIDRDSFVRYEAARSRLDQRSEADKDPFLTSKATLEAVHREGAFALGGTYSVYSTLYDLTALTVTHYPVSGFDQPICIDLMAELSRGARAVPLRERADNDNLNAALQQYRTKQTIGIGVAGGAVLLVLAMAAAILSGLVSW